MDIFFDGFDGLVQVLVTVPILYAAVILFVRIGGKRSTSQMNNFDWIVTVAMGSLTGSGIILSDVSLLEVTVAIGGLLALEFLVTRLVRQFDLAERMIKARPTVLVREGRFVDAALHAERVTQSEILAALRQNGLTDVKDAQWVVLETNAAMSVIPRREGREPRGRTTLQGVKEFSPSP